MTATDTAELERSRIVRELLHDLTNVKSWLRDSGRAVQPEGTTASFMALALLERHGRARLGELADRAHVDASVASRLVQHLEHDGLVAREPDPRDRRAQLIDLTQAGAAALERGRRQLEEAVARRLAGWSDEELDTVSTTLRRLLADLTAPA